MTVPGIIDATGDRTTVQSYDSTLTWLETLTRDDVSGVFRIGTLGKDGTRWAPVTPITKNEGTATGRTTDERESL